MKFFANLFCKCLLHFFILFYFFWLFGLNLRIISASLPPFPFPLFSPSSKQFRCFFSSNRVDSISAEKRNEEKGKKRKKERKKKYVSQIEFLTFLLSLTVTLILVPIDIFFFAPSHYYMRK